MIRKDENTSSCVYEKLRERIKGPVYPVIPAFKEDFSLDLEKIGEYVEFLNSNNAATLLLTAGTSRFNLLTDDEIFLMNQTVIDANQKRAVVIAANPIVSSTERTVNFACSVEKIGADALLLYFPERYYNDESVYDYFQTVAEKNWHRHNGSYVAHTECTIWPDVCSIFP